MGTDSKPFIVLSPLFILARGVELAIFQDIVLTLVTPLSNLWNGVIGIFPGLIAGLVIAVLGYFIALILGYAVKMILHKTKLDDYLEKLKLPKSIGKIKASIALGTLTKWYIFILFLQAAVDIMNLGTLSLMLSQLVLWLPQLILAVLTVFLGMFIAHYLSHQIELHSEMKGIKLASSFFRVLIIFIAVVIALEEIGLDLSILENAFLILLGSLGLGFALAIGLSFGLGAKDEAKDFASKFRKSL